MANDGHFTLEAAIGLAIVSSLALAAQMISSNAVSRNVQSDALFHETIRLETAMNCLPRIGRIDEHKRTAAACTDRVDIGQTSDNPVLRVDKIHAQSQPGETQSIYLLRIELAE